MKLSCPHCGDEFRYDAGQAGQTFACKYCHRPVQMPPASQLPPELREEYDSELERERQKEERRGQKAQAAARRETEARREEELRRAASARQAERERQVQELQLQLHAADRQRKSEWSATVEKAQVPSTPQYVYKMLQVPPKIVTDAAYSVGAAADYLENVVNDMAAAGWDFFRVDSIGVEIPPGCLGALFGQKADYTTYYVVTFRKRA